MKIAQVSDIHFGAEDPAATEMAVEVISASDCDAIIVCGDLTQRGKRSEFDAAAEWLKQFSMPILSVPGNHDVPLLNLAARASQPFNRYHSFLGQYDQSLELGGFRMCGYNTARGWQFRRNWAEGSVNVNHLAKLVNEDAPQILACHHPFLPLPNAPLKTRTRRGAQASHLLARSSVSLLLVGHVHTPSATVRRTELGSYLELSCGTLSKRTRSMPPSFNIVDIREDQIAVTAHSTDSSSVKADLVGSWSWPQLDVLA